jgi:two-component system CheB/CheR fusion protein
LFLDGDLKIRFFTPATRRLFSVIPTDVGRPLSDLTSLAADGALLADARTVLQGVAPIEREIETATGTWYVRRISPYRTDDNGVEGVVITFTDITDRRGVADALHAAKQQAEWANVAKSRFLAAASHDLRQPLQTLALVHGLLIQTLAEAERPQKLLARFEETLFGMSGMLDTLLDINQLEAGAITPAIARFPIDALLHQLREEFIYQAEARGLQLHVMPCSLSVESDPRLLDQMIRNLLSNALKYTEHGRILLGCRRCKGMLSVEIWDTGIGIPDEELQAVFQEYHQLDNPARERSRGLGLGLSIVQRLGRLLDHRVRVSSRPGKGSVFTIQVKLAANYAALPSEQLRVPGRDVAPDNAVKSGKILIIEDDPSAREMLELLLTNEGHRVLSAPHGKAALELVRRSPVRPDLILADYNLPSGMNGLQAAAKLREQLHENIPVAIVTGDITAATLREIADANCVQLYKPVKVAELREAIRRLLPNLPKEHGTANAVAGSPGPPVVFVVDDDITVRKDMRALLEADGVVVEDYRSAEAFLAAYTSRQDGCLLVDANLPGISGLELLRRMREAGYRLPAVMITGNGDVQMAVEAMKAGALDFLEKPVGHSDLVASVKRALEHSRDEAKLHAWRDAAATHIADLTPRQRQIMGLVLAGQPSKNIAADLGISQRTVENHRAEIMKRTGTRSLPALARLALAAAGPRGEGTAGGFRNEGGPAAL